MIVFNGQCAQWNRLWNWFQKQDAHISQRLSLTSMDPVLWLRMSGDLLWMVIGSDSGTARSVSSRERSSRLPGSVCFCPFWMREKAGTHMLIDAESWHGWKCLNVIILYLSRHLCRSRPETKASWCILLLLNTFDPWAEMKLYVEAFLRGEVLQKDNRDFSRRVSLLRLKLICYSIFYFKYKKSKLFSFVFTLTALEEQP